MAFTKLPNQVSAVARTKHTELVAVLGPFVKGKRAAAHAAGDALFYEIDNDAFVWTWGADAGKPTKKTVNVFAVRDDGLVVTQTWTSGSETFMTSKNKKLSKIDFGISTPEGGFVHDRLVLISEKEGVLVYNADTAKRLCAFGGVPKKAKKAAATDDDDDDDDPTVYHRIAAAPDHGLAVSAGDTLSIRDLDTGKARSEWKVPKELEVRDIAMSPDGAYLAGTTVNKKGWTVGSHGFAVFDVAKKKLVKKLTGHKPYTRNCVFVDDGRILVTASTDGTVRLWQTGTWKQLEVIDLKRTNDEIGGVIAWPARGAFAVYGSKGAVYVFAVGAAAAAADVPADAPRRDLYLIKGASNLVWRAELAAASYTMSWGKRGGAIHQRTLHYETPTDAQTAYRQAVAAKLGEGYKDAIA
jgi:WD40 repeat protein